MYQEELADFYYRVTLGNPNWIAAEKLAADTGKLALEKVKIGSRLHLEQKPAPPPVTIRIQQMFADGTQVEQAATVETVDAE